MVHTWLVLGKSLRAMQLAWAVEADLMDTGVPCSRFQLLCVEGTAGIGGARLSLLLAAPHGLPSARSGSEFLKGVECGGSLRPSSP